MVEYLNTPKQVYLTPKQIYQISQSVKASLKNPRLDTTTKIELESIIKVLDIYQFGGCTK